MTRVLLIIILNSVCFASYLVAQDRNSALSLSVGPTIVVGPETDSDVFSPGITFATEFSYRVHPNISIVPIKFSFTKYSVSVEKLNDYVEQIIRVEEPMTDLFLDEASLYELTFTPAIEFNTSREKAAIGVFQFGAGLSHTRSTASGTIMPWLTELPYDNKESENKFTIFFAGGIEVDLSSRISLMGNMHYWIIFNSEGGAEMQGIESGNTNGLTFTGGIKCHF